MVDSECSICGNQILQRTLLPCGHSSVCFPCFLSLTQCFHQNFCPICQKEYTQDPIILATSLNFNYQDEFNKHYPHDDTFHFYYSDSLILSLVQDLLQFHCPICKKVYKTFDNFSKHLSKHPKEHLITCKICYESNHFLPCYNPIFPSQSEISHSHFHSHPTCPICSYHAFDYHSLELHCKESHVRCNICATQDQIIWFMNHEDLYQHCKLHHFVCPHKFCDAVFGDYLELQHHLSQIHKEQISYELEINTRGSEIVNEAIESEELIIRTNQIKQRKKQLKQIATNDFQDQNKVKFLFDLMKQLNNKVLSVTEFLEKYDQLCGEWAQGLFIHTAAAIENPQIRAEIVKIRLGSGSCALRSRKKTTNTQELLPSLPSEHQQMSNLNDLLTQPDASN